MVRLCVLCVILPGALLAGPLYARYHLYSDQIYPLAMSDMRLIDNKVSTTWCQVWYVNLLCIPKFRHHNWHLKLILSYKPSDFEFPIPFPIASELRVGGTFLAPPRKIDGIHSFGGKQIEGNYLAALSPYEKALRQRNYPGLCILTFAFINGYFVIATTC